MCGISGYFSPHKNISRVQLQHITDAIAHRGPDAAGFYVNEEETAGLGHRRLSIIDLSNAANQPMYAHNKRYVAVFNGEVYNFREIQDKLGIKPVTTSDTEIIIEAFVQKGVEFVHLLNGMFAIAIYDIQEDVLWLFRDRLGVKPLYYFKLNNEVAFSSEMKGLMASTHISKNAGFNRAAIYTFLYAGYIPEPYTIYSNIHKLPAGSYARITTSSFEIKYYWKPEEKIEKAVVTDFNTAKKKLKDLLISSVKYRMISDVPFGTFLSGGIDSSLVTAIAQSVATEPVKTFTIAVKDPKYSEGGFAAAVAKHLGTKHHEFTVTEDDALNMVDKLVSVYDEPFSDSSGIPTMLVSKLARQHVTMALCGDGGDELFMGYGAYTWAKRLNNPLVKLARGPLAAGLSVFGSRYKRAAGVFKYPDVSRIKSHIFSQEQYFFSEQELANMLMPKYISKPLMQEEFGNLQRELTVQEEQALYDLKYYLKDDLLTKVDIASMQFSLEARTPFLDYRIVEFALNLHEDLKKKGDVTKYILKDILYEYVPKEIFDRPKRGFSIPLIKWLKNDLKYLVDDNLDEHTVNTVGVVNYNAVKSLITRLRNGEDYLYNRLWVLILLHKWMKEHAATAR